MYVCIESCHFWYELYYIQLLIVILSYYMQFIYYSQGIDWYSFNSTTFVYFENFVYI